MRVALSVLAYDGSCYVISPYLSLVDFMRIPFKHGLFNFLTLFTRGEVECVWGIPIKLTLVPDEAVYTLTRRTEGSTESAEVPHCVLSRVFKHFSLFQTIKLFFTGKATKPPMHEFDCSLELERTV